MTNLQKVSIKPKSTAFPTRKMSGISREGNITDNFDFFKDSLIEDWWDFTASASLPRFDDSSLVYLMGVKSTYTCTGTDSELEARKAEYLRVGIEGLLNFYYKSYDFDVVESLISQGAAKVVDYHMSPRPSSKLKFLIEIDAEFFNALPTASPPQSFSENLDESGNLITSEGLLNPTLNSNNAITSYDNISIITISSSKLEQDIEKSSFYMAHLKREMSLSGVSINGLNLYNEAEKLRLTAPAIRDLISYNFSDDGYSAGKNEDPTQIPFVLTGEEYKIRLAFKEDSSGLYGIEWISVHHNKTGDLFLGNGIKRFLATTPFDHQSTVRYFYFHQQILNNLDRNIQIPYSNFLEAYHYPPINMQEMLTSAAQEVPFQNFDDQGKNEKPKSAYSRDHALDNWRKRPPKCGFKFPELPDFSLDFTDLLQQILEPVNFSFDFKLTLFSLGPPCPAPFTGDTLPAILTEIGKDLKDSVLDQKKVLDQTAKDAEQAYDYVAEYFTSEEYVNDIEKRTQGFLLKMRQLGDLILNEFSLDKMLKLVCICLTQLGDDLLESQGIELQVPNASLSLSGPGVSFDPALLIDDPNGNINMKQALDANWGSFNVDAGLEPFQLEQLCSFCLQLPDFLLKLPSFDMLKLMLDLILQILEALLVSILTQLVMQLLKFLQRCPSFQCELRPKEGAPIADDYGNLDMEEFFPDDPDNPEEDIRPPILEKCPALFGISEVGDQLMAVQGGLFTRISQELSSGEMMNLLEGYASATTIYVVKEIIETEQQFEVIRPYINSVSKIESLIDCIADNVDPKKLNNFQALTEDPEYCPDPSKNPAFYMQSKCNNEEQTKRFLLRERSSKAARLKGVIDAIRVDPFFFESLIPELFSVRDPDTNKIVPGLLADEKIKPPVVDTLIEQYDPLVDNINSTARSEGSEFLQILYQNAAPNIFIPNDDTLRTNSTLQLATSLGLSLNMLTLPVALLTAPFSDPTSIPEGDINPDSPAGSNGRVINTAFPFVGGQQLKSALENAENSLSYSVNSGLLGTDSKFVDVTMTNKISRRFDSSINLNYPEGSLNSGNAIQLYFETVTNALNADSTSQNGLRNHVVVRLRCPSFFNNPNHVSFSYKVPLDYDNDGSMEEILPISDLSLSYPTDVFDYDLVRYSPQGFIFSQLIERGMSGMVSDMQPEVFTKFRRKVATSLYMTAFRDFIQTVANATKGSPYFTTYTYEDINEGVGSPGLETTSFKRFGRKKTYSDSGVAPFMQKYSAFDINPNGARTEVWWPPAPAMQDTPLRDGIMVNGEPVEYIDAEKMKENIKENWEWSEQYDPSDTDPNNLPPFSNAILDELIPEMIKFYCIEGALKSMPVTKIYKSNGFGSFRDEMYATVLSEIVAADVLSGNGTNYQNVFLAQINKYWERRYKEDENLNVEDAPKDLVAIKSLVNEYIGEAIQKASELANIKHLNESDEKVDIPLDLYVSTSPDSIQGVADIPNFLDQNIDADQILSTNTIPSDSTYTQIPELQRGGFVVESYVIVDMHSNMKDLIKEQMGQEFLDRLVGVPISLRGFESLVIDSSNVIISPVIENLGPASAEGNVLINYLVWLANHLTLLTSQQVKYNKIVDPNGAGLFKSMKLGLRLSYIVTGNPSVESWFSDVILPNADQFDDYYEAITGPDSKLIQDKIQKEKCFIFNEGGNKVLSFPIIKFEPEELDFATIDLYTENVAIQNEASEIIAASNDQLGNLVGGNINIDDEYPILSAIVRMSKLMKFDALDRVPTKAESISLMKNSSEWNALFGYVLPEGLASNIVSVYSFLNLLEGLSNKQTFKRTRALYKLFFTSATTKSGLDGKPASEHTSEFDIESMIPEDMKEDLPDMDF